MSELKNPDTSNIIVICFVEIGWYSFALIIVHFEKSYKSFA